MNLNYKLFFKYIFFWSSNLFLKHNKKNDKFLYVYIQNSHLYYLSLHLKLSSFFYSTQLIDIFSYEIPKPSNLPTNDFFSISKPHDSILVYNFHSILFNQRFFFFTFDNSSNLIKKMGSSAQTTISISELFLNANWLEREVAELHGIFFSGKKDLRNLMLPYGDTSAPMKKTYPSIGLREIFYDSVSDLLVQAPVTIQF